ncbi:hypothetical protein GBAR_LOCUS13763 [Geodia barretti]|uniref:Uncharacterized protein n=1 Tax=Geodia barretti TaxID=519541 RepID=A0AA35WR49_GEOBA|nr:hypothetical protein GBAR_LOCUS13763 [Geodia barretti]
MTPINSLARRHSSFTKYSTTEAESGVQSNL